MDGVATALRTATRTRVLALPYVPLPSPLSFTCTTQVSIWLPTSSNPGVRAHDRAFTESSDSVDTFFFFLFFFFGEKIEQNNACQRQRVGLAQRQLTLTWGYFLDNTVPRHSEREAIDRGLDAAYGGTCRYLPTFLCCGKIVSMAGLFADLPGKSSIDRIS